MPNDIDNIADAVVALLDFLSAEKSYSPEFDLQELSTQKCVVVPISVEPKRICRNSRLVEMVYRIEVGILVRSKKLDVPALVKLVKKTADICSRCSVGNAKCTKVDYEPLFDADQLRQRNQFTSVLALTFKEIVENGNSNNRHE
jgi:hypothetical protein